VEIAIPWTAYSSRLPVVKPVAGAEWRVNFSRVEWKAGQPKEDNWVWSPRICKYAHPGDVGLPALPLTTISI